MSGSHNKTRQGTTFYTPTIKNKQAHNTNKQGKRKGSSIGHPNRTNNSYHQEALSHTDNKNVTHHSNTLPLNTNKRKQQKPNTKSKGRRRIGEVETDRQRPPPPPPNQKQGQNEKYTNLAKIIMRNKRIRNRTGEVEQKKRKKKNKDGPMDAWITKHPSVLSIRKHNQLQENQEYEKTTRE